VPPPPADRTVDALLRVLAEAGLPAPDVLELRDHEVVALYHEQKLAVVVELDDDEEEEPTGGETMSPDVPASAREARRASPGRR
jgi:hypothetical protein